MLRLRSDENIKPALRGKQVEMLIDQSGICRVKLLENAGAHKIGDELSTFRSQIEEYDEESNTVRFYNPDFADNLDNELNRPYEPANMPCSRENCDNENGFNYALTGYVVDDGQGMYVEKKCERCGTVTVDGDGDFHDYFHVENGNISRKIERNNDAVDERLFFHYDNGDTAALEKELHEHADRFANQFNPDMTAEQRELAVRRTIESIDDETESIDASMSANLTVRNE